MKILKIGSCVPVVSGSLERLDTGSNHMNGRAHAALQILTRALEVNSSLEEIHITDDNISDNGIADIAKSLQKNNTLKVLHLGTKLYKKFMPVTSLTDTGVLSLARCVATNTSFN